jgi:putative FmdB family regulatory protein
MPIYAYKCDSCGHQLDALQKVSDAVLTGCPACGEPRLVKQITAAGFQLKGSGWYATDFRNNGKAAAGKDGAKDAAQDAPASAEAPGAGTANAAKPPAASGAAAAPAPSPPASAS